MLVRAEDGDRLARLDEQRLVVREALERVRALVRARVPPLENDRYLAPDIAAAAELVTSGALAETVRDIPLPACAGDDMGWSRS